MTEPDLSQLRREYVAEGLAEDDLADDPTVMFRRWMHDALTAGLHEPNAMVVATVSGSGRPSARTVLLKGHDERGFVFFTNYESRKGGELEQNPLCALLFPWHVLGRQVRVEGTARRLTRPENEAYFSSRPHASQIGAWASPQSHVVRDRAELDTSYDAAATRFRDGEVSLPPYWGGYRVTPEAVEFWQGRQGRMHDRLRYRRASAGDPGSAGGTGWVTERLAP
jgi:pyridoxamine 5'-phosphate oxidase